MFWYKLSASIMSLLVHVLLIDMKMERVSKEVLFLTIKEKQDFTLWTQKAFILKTIIWKNLDLTVAMLRKINYTPIIVQTVERVHIFTNTEQSKPIHTPFFFYINSVKIQKPIRLDFVF